MAKPTERALFLLGGAGTDKTKGSAAIRSVTRTRIETENARLVPCRDKGVTNVTSRVGCPYAAPYLYGYRTD